MVVSYSRGFLLREKTVGELTLGDRISNRILFAVACPSKTQSMGRSCDTRSVPTDTRYAPSGVFGNRYVECMNDGVTILVPRCSV